MDLLAQQTDRMKKEEHAFKTIEKRVKDGAISGTLFFFGTEEYLVQWAISSILDRYIDPGIRELNFSKIDGTALTLEMLISQCETLPMMAERRVVLVTDFAVLSGGKTKGFQESDETELGTYLSSLPDTTILIFTASSADKRRKLYKSMDKAGGCFEFGPLDEKLLKGFIEKRLRQAGKTAKSSVIHRWIEMTGYYDKETDYTLYNLENDIRKVVAFCDHEEVLWEEIAQISAGNAETYVFSMIDALSENRKGEAFRILHNLLRSGESEYKLIALICSQIEVLFVTKELTTEGKPLAQMKNEVSIHEFRLRRAIPLVSRYSLAQLRDTLSRAYEVDRSIKLGTLDAKLALELLIASV